MRLYYKLDEDNRVVPCTLEEWSTWMWQNPDQRVVKKTDLGKLGEVSTVFLGLDHRFSTFDGEGDPIVFETMVFNSELEEYTNQQWRYTTYNEALTHHHIVCGELLMSTPTATVT